MSLYISPLLRPTALSLIAINDYAYNVLIDITYIGNMAKECDIIALSILFMRMNIL